MTDPINNSVKTAHFKMNGNTFPLMQVHPNELEEMRKDPETGLKRDIYGYPLYWDILGGVWPLPEEGIKVIYE